MPFLLFRFRLYPTSSLPNLVQITPIKEARYAYLSRIDSFHPFNLGQRQCRCAIVGIGIFRIQRKQKTDRATMLERYRFPARLMGTWRTYMGIFTWFSFSFGFHGIFLSWFWALAYDTPICVLDTLSLRG